MAILNKISSFFSTSKLSFNAFSNITQAVLGSLLMFVMYRYLNDNLGIVMIGIWSVVIATVSSSRLVDVAFSSGITVFVSKFISQKDFQSVRESIDTVSFILMGLLTILLPILYPFLNLILSYIFSDEDLSIATMVLPYSLLSAWFVITASVFQGTLDGFQKMFLRASLIIFGQIFLLLLIYLLVPKYGIIGLVWSQIIQSIFLFIFGRLLIMKLVPKLRFFPVFIRFNIIKQMINYGINVQFSTFLQLLQDPITKGLIASYGGSAIAGYYEIAYQIVYRVRSLIVAANNAIVPHVASLNLSSPNSLKDLYSKNISIVLIVSPVVFCVLHLLSGIISSLLVNSVSYELLFIMSILVLAWGYNTIGVPAYFFNMGNERVFHNTKHHLVTGILNIFFGLLMGYFFDWKGVVIGTSLAIAMGTFYLLKTHNIYDKKSSKLQYIKEDLWIFITCIIIYIYGWFYPINLESQTYTSLALNIVIPLLFLSILVFKHPNIKYMLERDV